MTDPYRERVENSVRLARILKHAALLIDCEEILSEDGIYKLACFSCALNNLSRFQRYGDLLESLRPLLNRRYEYLSGEVDGRLMLLFSLPVLSCSADSVWIDSVCGETARMLEGVSYSSSMVIFGAARLGGAFAQVIDEEAFDRFADHPRHAEQSGSYADRGDYPTDAQLFDSLSRSYELAILSGNSARLQAILDEAVGRIVYLTPYKPEEIHRRTEMFVNALLDRLSRDGWLMDSDTLRMSVLNDLLFCKNESSLRLRAGELTERLREAVREKKQSGPAAAEQLRDYIDRNIGDVNLCVTSLSSAFEKRGRVLDELFRKRYGTSLFSYIRSRRLAFASELLRDTELDVMEICERAGYGSMNTMIRAFRQEHGMSPSAYRAEARSARTDES